MNATGTSHYFTLDPTSVNTTGVGYVKITTSSTSAAGSWFPNLIAVPWGDSGEMLILDPVTASTDIIDCAARELAALRPAK